jgi:ferredoxin
MAYAIDETCIGCTACTKRCPTDAISGVRNGMHIIDPELCIDCGACGVVCPVECIHDEVGEICKGFPRREWPKAIVIEENCIGSGCEQCIAICPFDALELDLSGERVSDHYGVAKVIEKRCTGCRLCEQSCAWDAIYIDPPREVLAKRIYAPVELAETTTG